MGLKEDLERMVAEDSSGPWRVVVYPDYNDDPIYAVVKKSAKLSEAGEPDDYDDIICNNQNYYPRAVEIENQTAIVSARTDRPALVELVRLLAERYQTLDNAKDSELELLWDKAKQKAGEK